MAEVVANAEADPKPETDAVVVVVKLPCVKVSV